MLLHCNHNVNTFIENFLQKIAFIGLKTTNNKKLGMLISAFPIELIFYLALDDEVVCSTSFRFNN
jgi:hypothetical protein